MSSEKKNQDTSNKLRRKTFKPSISSLSVPLKGKTVKYSNLVNILSRFSAMTIGSQNPERAAASIFQQQLMSNWLT